MNKIIPATKARQQFFKLIQETDQPGQSITISVEGVPKVVMMSWDDFESWQETLEIMTDKNLMKGIEEGIKDIQKGNLYTIDELKKELNLDD